MFKVTIIVGLLALTQASHIPLAPLGYDYPAVPLQTRLQPVVVPATSTIISKPPAHYDYGYTVSDPYSGDHKSAYETRRGDAVAGSYSFLDASGTKHTVDYTADAAHGFNANVHKEPAKVVVAAPSVVRAVSAPGAPIRWQDLLPYFPG
ncbi:larval cuticle protein A3A-like [Aethina tumida]|uniref:larval cuticle protein A3A-like n=1 Tax=Aethina tumida TaxID=116153 RepID=UPI00096B548D|nr:larval cuticle protein A3A-like [Aethina tumida]